MGLTLTADDLRDLTGRKTRPAQIVRLKAMGIRYLDDPGAAQVKVLWSWVGEAAGDRRAPDEPIADYSWMQKKALDCRP